MKVIGKSARCADLTIRLIVKANSMSARIYNIVVNVIPVLGHIQHSVISNIVVSVILAHSQSCVIYIIVHCQPFVLYYIVVKATQYDDINFRF